MAQMAQMIVASQYLGYPCLLLSAIDFLTNFKKFDIKFKYLCSSASSADPQTKRRSRLNILFVDSV